MKRMGLIYSLKQDMHIKRKEYINPSPFIKTFSVLVKMSKRSIKRPHSSLNEPKLDVDQSIDSVLRITKRKEGNIFLYYGHHSKSWVKFIITNK